MRDLSKPKRKGGLRPRAAISRSAAISLAMVSTISLADIPKWSSNSQFPKVVEDPIYNIYLAVVCSLVLLLV